MQKMNSSQARNEFAALLDRVQRQPVEITRNGRKIAVMMSYVDYEAEQKQKMEWLKAHLDMASLQVKDQETEDVSDADPLLAIFED